jgi:tRNA(Leu) C34 or U34 (ribose-2'-O)-methylase TrmL
MSYFEIGIYHPKTRNNVGTLWRSAYQLGASGLFTIGRRYERQSSDTWHYGWIILGFWFV